MQHRLPITVRLESFEGPLDLLLHLIQSHELDISKVSISKVTDQYLAYIRLIQELNFDIASEFLVVAATMVLWKSRSLLPEFSQHTAGDGSQEAELNPLDLVRQLMEHQQFQQVADSLGRYPLLGDDFFIRTTPLPPAEKIWKQMNTTDLTLTYQDVLVRSRKRTQVLKKETVSIAEKVHHFASLLEIGKMMEFRKLLTDPTSRAETVVTFLASLEMARLKKLRIFQEATFSEIYLELLSLLSEQDFELGNALDREMNRRTNLPGLAVQEPSLVEELR